MSSDSLLLQVGDIAPVICTPSTGGQPLPNSCVWRSRDTNVAWVAANGTQTATVTALKRGKTWVDATAKGQRDSLLAWVVTCEDSSMFTLLNHPRLVNLCGGGQQPATDGCLRTRPVSTPAGFLVAVNDWLPGDCIMVAAGTYSFGASITLNRSGTAANRILVQGAGVGSTIFQMNVNAINWNASYIDFRGIRVTNVANLGIWLKGAHHNVFDAIQMDQGVQGFMKFKDGSHHNVVKNSRFRDNGSGALPQYAEAMYVGNSSAAGVQFTNTDNQFLNNHFGPNIKAEAIDIKEGSDRTIIRGNFIDGTGTLNVRTAGLSTLIAVRGSHCIIDDNHIQFGNPNAVSFYDGGHRFPMVGNLVTNNRVHLRNIHNTPVNFYAFNRTGGTTAESAVVVKCSNTVVNGAFSQHPCAP